MQKVKVHFDPEKQAAHVVNVTQRLPWIMVSPPAMPTPDSPPHTWFLTLPSSSACTRSSPSYLYPSKNKQLPNPHSVTINKKNYIVFILPSAHLNLILSLVTKSPITSILLFFFLVIESDSKQPRSFSGGGEAIRPSVRPFENPH